MEGSNLIMGDSNSIFIELEGFNSLAEPGLRVADILEKLKKIEGGDTLIIGVGVNDSAMIIDAESGNKIAPDIKAFEEVYSELIEIAKGKFKRVICVGLISSTQEDVTLGSATIRYDNYIISEFDKVIKELCKKYEAEFVDVLPHFLGNESELLTDHIHPNEKGRVIINREIASLLA